MKFNKIYIVLLFAISALFAGCSDWEDTIVPSDAAPEGCQGVYFPTTNKPLFELEPADAKELTLTIARTLETGTAEVPLNVEINTEDIFVVPATVSFADGETEVEFKVTFPNAGEGTAYNLKIAVEGDQYINPYASTTPYVNTSASRIKWEELTDQWIYIDGAFKGIYAVGQHPMYVSVEKAQLAESVRYRFKNAYKDGTGAWDGDDWVATPDAEGIFDGYPYTWPGEFDASKDWYTTIEIYDAAGKSGEVSMNAHEIGVAWSSGMMSMGSVYGNVSDDKGKYPLGKIANGVITFGENSLYFSEAGRNDGAPYPSTATTTIYTTKEAFIKANLKIEDFNDVEYEVIVGEVSEFWSNATSKVVGDYYETDWNQTIAMAIDADPENEESEYKNLYYLADLYSDGKGLAFYYEDGGKVKIPENQPTGLKVFGSDVYVTQSNDIESSVTENGFGVKEYILGLTFHYEDGTVLGEFAEEFYYAKTMPTYELSDFVGNYVMSGSNVLGGTDANYDVKIAAGTEVNELIITGLRAAEEVVATFDAATGYIAIEPQALADVELSDGTMVDASLLTAIWGSDGKLAISTTDVLSLHINMRTKIAIVPTSEAVGYLIFTADLGGFFDGQIDVEFTPVESEAEVASLSVLSPQVQSAIAWHEQAPKPQHNFKVQGNMNSRSVKKNVTPVMF